MMKQSTPVYRIFSIVLCLVIPLALLFNSCGKPEFIPSYIHIDSVGLLSHYGTDGSNSHYIPDAWVYVDEQLVGCFELPATIPVPYAGNHSVQIQGGILESGSTAERPAYPFYAAWTVNANLVQMQTLKLKPVVSYLASCHPFDWTEDFESPGISLVFDTSAASPKMLKDTLHPFEGHASGSVYLNAAQSHFEGTTSLTFTLGNSGQELYLELNYMNTNEFYIDILNASNFQQLTFVTVKPSPVWKKMYVRLTDALTQAGVLVGGTYQVYLGMDRDVLVSNPQLHLDNLKLIH